MSAFVSVITASNPNRLTKRWHLEDGKAVKDPAGNLVSGSVEPCTVSSPLSLVDLLTFGLNKNQALCYGIPNDGLAHELTTQAALLNGTAPAGAIARNKESFRWADDAGWLMIDYDPAPEGDVLTRDELMAALFALVPAIEHAPMVWNCSSSSYIWNDETERFVSELAGQRVYILVQDARDIERAGSALFAHSWLAAHGYIRVSNAGTLLERSLMDASVWQPSRLDFAAEPVCVAPLRNDRPMPEPFNNDARPLDTMAAIPALTKEQTAALKEIKATARQDPSVCNDQAEMREVWVLDRLDKLPANITEEARQQKEKSLRAAVGSYRLWGDFELTHSSGETVTVGVVLDDPERWHGERFADPLDPSKDQRVAWANLRSGGRPYLYSHAHGGQRFMLLRPVESLQLAKGELPRMVTEILDRLRIEGEVYERAGGLVRFADSELVSVERPWLQTCLERKYEFLSFDGRSKQWRQQDCPSELAGRVMAARGDWMLPKVTGVVTFPVMRGNGTINNRAGFDPDTGLLFIDHSPNRPAPYPMDRKGLADALARIWEPFGSFPFDSDLSRAVFFSALLSTVCRPALPTAPAYLVRAYAAGTGKTLLSECLMLLVGAPLSALPLPESNSEEIEKRLFAKLLTGCAGLVLDNLTGVIESSALCAVLTSKEPEGRILGRSEVVRIQNRALFVLNGNNVTAGGDLFRRVLPITLDANSESPERRRFTFDPRALISQRLDAYRADLLSVLLTYQQQGAPIVGTGAFGSFNEWEAVVRQCVCWLIREGLAPAPMADPLGVLEQSKEEDPAHLQHVAILEAWHERYGSRPIRVNELVEAMRNNGFPDASDDPLDVLLSETGVPPRGRGAFCGRYFGGWLKRHRGRVAAGLRLDSAKYGKTENAWAVTKA